MSELSEATRQLIEALKTERDDLRVQMHLASSEVQDRLAAQWSELERKLGQLKADARLLGERVESGAAAVGDELQEVASELGTGGRAVVRDLRAGYAKIRQSLSGRD